MGLVAVPVCVCARELIQSCSNCKVQQAYFPTTAANHEFCVRPCRGAALTGRLSQHVCVFVCLCVCVCVCMCMCVCVCVCAGGGLHLPRPCSVAVHCSGGPSLGDHPPGGGGGPSSLGWGTTRGGEGTYLSVFVVYTSKGLLWFRNPDGWLTMNLRDSYCGRE